MTLYEDVVTERNAVRDIEALKYWATYGETIEEKARITARVGGNACSFNTQDVPYPPESVQGTELYGFKVFLTARGKLWGLGW